MKNSSIHSIFNVKLGFQLLCFLIPIPVMVWSAPNYQIQVALDKVTPPLSGKVMHFPLLIRVGQEAQELFQMAKPDGSQLQVTQSDGKPLPLEVESWDATQKKGCLWVLVDTVSPQMSSMTFYLGLSEQAIQSPKSVFAAADGWSGVYHMEGRGFESTEQAPAAQDSGTSPASGAIGNARGFSNVNAYATSGSYLNLGAPASLNLSGIITMEAWVRWNSKLNHRVILCHGATTSNSTETVLRVGEFQDYRTGVWNGKAAHHAHAVAAASDSAKWIYLAGTYDGTQWSLFRNGVKVADTIDAVGAQNSPGNWRIGAQSTGSAVSRYFHGDIDEVRISKVARSADYFNLSYATQNMELKVVTVTAAPSALAPFRRTGRSPKLLRKPHSPELNFIPMGILPDGRRITNPMP